MARLQAIAGYLYNKGGDKPIHLEKVDYRKLGAIIESHVPDPGVYLRRHHLLVMDKPLQLLLKISPPQWKYVQLSELGAKLAVSPDPASILELALRKIQFAREPWSPPDRVKQYDEFDVGVYGAAYEVLSKCSGYIDRNEFDLFMSRIRDEDEITWAIDHVQAYRQFDESQKVVLINEVRARIPSAKIYQNWRDIALHTFSLFGLGTSMIRDSDRLLLVNVWDVAHEARPVTEVVPHVIKAVPDLKLPELPECEDLMTPPTAPASNLGTDAESFFEKMLRSEGWEVAFYTNKRGYGFDLWARRGDRAMLVEVKSSLGTLGAVNLTSIEYRAAKEHGDNSVLALVEDLDSDAPKVYVIQNPAAKIRIKERQATTYTMSRAEWFKVAKKR